MLGTGTRIAAFLLTLFVGLAACTNDAPPSSPPSPQPVEVPITVEVTRLVSQQLIVEATPTPLAPCAPTDFAQTEFITIGAILPLSRPGNLITGFDMQSALDIAVASVNRNGGVNGVPVHLVTYDSTGSAARAREFATRLVTQDCVIAIVGLAHDETALAVSDVAHTYGVPVIVANASADSITGRQYAEVFRVAPAESQIAQMPANWLNEIGDYNKDDARLAILVSETSDNDDRTLELSVQALGEVGYATQWLTIDLPASDFSPLVARIVALERLPDVLFIAVQGPTALEIQAQLYAAGIGPHKSTLVVSNPVALDSQLFWSTIPDGSGTIVNYNGPWYTTVTPAADSFVQEYNHLYGSEWPKAHAFAAYDSVLLLLDAIERAQSLAFEDLITALEATDIELAAGRYHFAAISNRPQNADSLPDYLWHQWPDPPLLLLQYTEVDQASANIPVVWPPVYRTVDAPLIR